MNKKLIYMACLLPVLCACSSRVDEPATEVAEPQTHVVKARLNVSFTDYDATRDGDYVWEDGSMLFLVFGAEGGNVSGQGVYDREHDDWTVTYTGESLAATSVTVSYVEGVKQSSQSIAVGYAKPLYRDDNGTCVVFESGNITLTCNLAPVTARVRFQGSASDRITVSGLKYVASFSSTTGEVAYSNSKVSLTPSSETGYTDYIYGLYDNDANKVTVLNNGVTYSTTTKALASGQSVWLQIPTADSNQGWENDNYKGHEYVDLGLPSGLKWATCNVGASSSTEYGDYFAWGETSTKSSYTADNSLTYNKSVSTLQSSGIIDSNGNLAPFYDAATTNWGGSWRIPTKDEEQELIDKCTWTWITELGVNGYKVTGPNGNYIFLPAAGSRYGSDLDYAGSWGCYWSSTIPSNGSIYYLEFDYDDHYVLDYSRFHGQSVRPVSE